MKKNMLTVYVRLVYELWLWWKWHNVPGYNMVLNNNFHKHFLHKKKKINFMSTSAHNYNSRYCSNVQLYSYTAAWSLYMLYILLVHSFKKLQGAAAQ